MIRYLVAGLLGIVFFNHSVAQLPSGFFLVPDSAFYSTAVVRYATSGSAGSFPCTVDLRPVMPPVIKQVNHTDCAAHIVGFAVAGYMKHKIMGATYTHDDGRWNKDNLFSPFFLHNPSARVPAEVETTWGICQTPPGLGTVIGNYNAAGCCNLNCFFPDTTSPMFCVPTPSASCYTQASAYRPLNHTVLASSTDPGTDMVMTDAILQEIRNLLAEGIPVIVGVLVDKFSVFKGHTNKPSGYEWVPTTTERDYHAMLVVGYEHKKKRFILRNTLGENWGDGGYMRISYSNFKARAYSAFYYPLQYRVSVLRADSSAMAFVPSQNTQEPQPAKYKKRRDLTKGTFIEIEKQRIAYLNSESGKGSLFSITEPESGVVTSFYAFKHQPVQFAVSGKMFEFTLQDRTKNGVVFAYKQLSISQQEFIKQQTDKVKSQLKLMIK
ncbi:MAG: C1 family peptidase [Chitinophagales bacterium]|nr:C1 family peptidase [Chitinophagales bacterium]